MCLGGHLCFPLLRKSCCVKVVNVAEPSAIVYFKVTNVTTTWANLARVVKGYCFLALQENDHMTKIEVFHCAACNIFLSTSSSLVHSHLTSQEHLSNTKVSLPQSHGVITGPFGLIFLVWIWKFGNRGSARNVTGNWVIDFSAGI